MENAIGALFVLGLLAPPAVVVLGALLLLIPRPPGASRHQGATPVQAHR